MSPPPPQAAHSQSTLLWHPLAEPNTFSCSPCSLPGSGRRGIWQADSLCILRAHQGCLPGEVWGEGAHSWRKQLELQLQVRVRAAASAPGHGAGRPDTAHLCQGSSRLLPCMGPVRCGTSTDMAHIPQQLLVWQCCCQLPWADDTLLPSHCVGFQQLPMQESWAGHQPQLA